MAGINKVILVGNLGSDPDLRSTPSGVSVCEFSVATNETWKGKDGQTQDRTEWHKIIIWGKLGENCSKFLSKGRQVYVEGRLQTRSWEDKEGNKRYTTEIVARDIQFLGGGGGGNRADGGQEGPPPPKEDFGGGGGGNGGGGNDGGGGGDDIPF
ncbi:MAG: single-stranded DNA-binding protein [Kofleriaceae bacterium]|nr:single-stranded DNA-binding protein [Kofleriaceae bacterium]